MDLGAVTHRGRNAAAGFGGDLVLKRWFRRGAHRARRHGHSLTVFDIKMALVNEKLAAQKPWTLADLEDLRAMQWAPHRAVSA